MLGIKHKKQQLKVFFWTVVFIPMLLVSFNNCSEHTGVDEESSLLIGNCSVQDHQDLFGKTYHPFLKNHCSTCHVAGPGKGSFAAPDQRVAFEAFSLVGFSRISTFATDSGHQSPYTGTKHEQEIDKLKATWALGSEELIRCKQVDEIEDFVGDPWEETRTYSRSKGINPSLDNNESIIRWDLNNEMMPPPEGVTWPSLPGAFFEVTVTFAFQGGKPAYYFTRPRIVYPSFNQNATDMVVESIRFKVNGREVINETTFHRINANAYDNVDTLLSSGAMVAVGSVKGSDVLSFSLGKVTPTVLPDPPPAPELSFASATTNYVEGSGQLNLILQLSRPVDNFVTVGLSIDGANTDAKGPCCDSILDENLESVEIRNFDVDYEFADNTFTIVFEPSTTVMMVPITIYDDDRLEGSEKFKVDIGDVLIGGQRGLIGNNSSHVVTISDNGDVAPQFDEITYSDLMRPGGIFYQYCLRCHHLNSFDASGREYDMTTYTDLIARDRAIPGDPANSQIMQRMNSLNAEKVMPLDGLLPLDKRKLVENWILNGAKNN